jgi:hypothetical protein
VISGENLFKNRTRFIELFGLWTNILDAGYWMLDSRYWIIIYKDATPRAIDNSEKVETY